MGVDQALTVLGVLKRSCLCSIVEFEVLGAIDVRSLLPVVQKGPHQNTGPIITLMKYP